MEGSTLHSAVSARALKDLIAGIEAIEHRHVGGAAQGVLTGWGPPCESLVCGRLHEWCGPDAAPGGERVAPLLIFAHLARQAAEQLQRAWVVWIGGHWMWPQPHALRTGLEGPRLIQRSLLLDPATDADRLWAIDLCLRSPAVAAVMADGRGLGLAHTRRLQLAAENGGALALLSRPAHDLRTPSAAATRLRVQCIPSPTQCPRWRIEVVRCKGMQRGSGMDAGGSLILEHHRATSCVRVPSQLADRPAQATARHAG